MNSLNKIKDKFTNSKKKEEAKKKKSEDDKHSKPYVSKKKNK